jgi:hypothetical protein
LLGRLANEKAFLTRRVIPLERLGEVGQRLLRTLLLPIHPLVTCLGNILVDFWWGVNVNQHDRCAEGLGDFCRIAGGVALEWGDRATATTIRLIDNARSGAFSVSGAFMILPH